MYKLSDKMNLNDNGYKLMRRDSSVKITENLYQTIMPTQYFIVDTNNREIAEWIMSTDEVICFKNEDKLLKLGIIESIKRS